jgi:diacylglycerol kinase (ATP)
LAGVVLSISRLEWCFVILAMMAVWTAEALNTSLELLADVVSPDVHTVVGRAKDVAAGAVLISALGSVAIGVFVLGPHCLRMVGIEL